MSSAFTPSNTSISTFPTAMDNATSTRLGYKSYSHGTTYNGGNAPTVTGNAGFAHIGSSFIPYQMASGNWRLKINISYSQNSATNADVLVAGILALRDSALSAAHNASETFLMSRTIAGSNQLVVRAGVATTTFCVSGDFELVSKPTWAY